MSASPYLTIREAAEYVRLSTWTVRRAISDGELVAYGPRGQIRILRSDLEAWVASTAITAKSEKAPTPRPRPRQPSRTFRDRVGSPDRGRPEGQGSVACPVA